MNWKIIFGNSFFSSASAITTMLAGNTTNITNIEIIDILKISIIMGFLYFITAFGRELIKEGENEESKKLFLKKTKNYAISNKSDRKMFLDFFLPI